MALGPLITKATQAVSEWLQAHLPPTAALLKLKSFQQLKKGVQKEVNGNICSYLF